MWGDGIVGAVRHRRDTAQRESSVEQNVSIEFNAQYEALSKDVFGEIVREDVAGGAHVNTQAREYAERGKPDFALAYLLVSELPDTEKREVLARAYEQRAVVTEQRAHEFDRKFHRPFPLLHTEAEKDRATAKLVRAGRAIHPDADRPLLAQ